ncbi:MAG: UbiA family prenyltransferase [Chitinispirillaceae bacterium]|nr:UbiA family prenyltransferase [Chitinispirillaceae bacterium]
MKKTSAVQKILDRLFLLRIPLLAPVGTILFLGWITGSGSARFGGFLADPASLSIRLWIGTAGFFFIAASIYVVNQIVDIESDRINRKLFLLPQGLVSVRTAWVIAGLCAVCGLVIAAAVIADAALVAVFLVSLVLGALYNLKPVQLKNNPFGGVCAGAIGNGLLTFLAGWYLAGTHQEAGGILPLTSGLLSGLSPTLANAAVYLATTIPDAPGDRMTGKKTFCVVYGEKKTAAVAALLCAAAFATSFLMFRHFWVMAVPAAISLVFFLIFAVSTKKENAFKAFKWPVFLLTAFVVIFSPEFAVLILIIFFGSRAYYKWRFDFDYPTLKPR